MNRVFNIFVLLFCIHHSFADSWTQKANLGGSIRGASAGFSIGTKGYIGTGINFSSSPAFFKDFWEWDQATNTWTQKANFGGTARSGAVGFSIGTKGYIATGYDANIVTRDMWEYDPSSNTWTQKAMYGGVGRDYAVAFSISGKGYLGTGYNSVSTNYNDFWQYNPLTNTWTQMANVPGGPRSSAIGFAVNGKGYIGTGYDSGPKDDFYEYDPSSNTWVQKADVPGGPRSDANSFAISNKGYVVAGVVGSVNQKDLWEYDPSVNTWTQKANLTGAAREDAVSFSIGNKGYIGTGYDNSFNRLKDFWEYGPDLSPLPVELTAFSAYKENGIVVIKWETLSETNNSFFTVEKSKEDLAFEKIAEVKGQGTSSQPHAYSTLDMRPFEGMNYYRLCQSDLNGNSTYSRIVSVEMIKNIPFNIYPNPVKDDLFINTTVKGCFEITVLSLTGKIVFTKAISTSGTSAISINLSNLMAGCYLITLENLTEKYSGKIIKID